MARTALLPRLRWQPAIISDTVPETATATTLRLAVDGWPGHRAGQHVDLRLTALDGYTAVRPYSLASPAGSPDIEVTVAHTPGGEVSTYLIETARAGHHLEVRGPLGNWFVWDPADLAPVQLIGGGSGVVPLISMLRTHDAHRSAASMRLLYSVSRPEDVLYEHEIRTHVDAGTATVLYSRTTPPDVTRPAGRITMADLHVHAQPTDLAPHCFVCGPTGFVETVIDRLVALGHAPDRIRAERYGERSKEG